MEKFYSDEKNTQVLIALLKEHGIKKVIASPGATNITLLRSMQVDPFFEMYSSVDERSAAYIACGLAAESGEPVIISCTGATASRNYLPGLTEAYYRKLPVLAITATQNTAFVGHLKAQVIDRSSIQNDVVKVSVTLPIIKDDNDLWENEIKINRALLELRRNGGGPVHINFTVGYNRSYTTKKLPLVRVVNRITLSDKFPEFPEGKIAVFISSHNVFSSKETDAIDKFCAAYDAVVFCDHSSNYKGKYRVLFQIVASQNVYDHTPLLPDIVISIGEITGDYYAFMPSVSKQVWRVSEDGEIRDQFGKLRYVFEMSEQSFFEHYNRAEGKEKTNYLRLCQERIDEIYNHIPELPFSNIWIASKMAHCIPENSVIHFGILNSLRSWNFFDIPNSVMSSSNVGGFGIDGCISTLLGASLVNSHKLYFGIVGDLAFFYDMNAIGNRHIGNNLRILLINNGKGAEFRLYDHLAYQFGDEADEYFAAARHYGNQSRELVKHYVQDLGFEYLCASNKQEFELVYERFISEKITEKSILFEVFTNSSDESDALEKIRHAKSNAKGELKKIAKQVLGKKGTEILKTIIK